MYTLASECFQSCMYVHTYERIYVHTYVRMYVCIELLLQWVFGGVPFYIPMKPPLLYAYYVRNVPCFFIL